MREAPRPCDFMADIPMPKTTREAQRWWRVYWSRWLSGQDMPDMATNPVLDATFRLELYRLSKIAKR